MLQQTSLDALARRSSLVAQLRFAVTMQDLRTVILLRRQLNQEQTRGRPWIRVPAMDHALRSARRGIASVLASRLTRLVRMTAFAAMAGVFQAMVVRGTTPALLGTALMLFLLGLEAMEPLSQEIDQPDRTDSLPIERGELLVRHLDRAGHRARAVRRHRRGQPRSSCSAPREPSRRPPILALPTVLGRCGRRRRQHRPRRTRSRPAARKHSSRRRWPA